MPASLGRARSARDQAAQCQLTLIALTRKSGLRHCAAVAAQWGGAQQLLPLAIYAREI